MRISLFFIYCLLFCIFSDANAQEDLVACGDDKVIILDGEKAHKGDTLVKWLWKVTEATDLPLQYQKLMVPLDECKPVDKGKKLLLTSSGGGVVLLDVTSRKVLFYARVPMAHSAEILPGNRMAVVLSTHREGNSIELYDINKPEQRLYKDSLYSGHGVVWNDTYKRLFVLGFDELRCYSLKDWDSRQPGLTLEKTWKLPEEGGHDLSAINDNEMLVSMHHNIYLFNIPGAQFAVFGPLADQHNIKSANYNRQSGQLVYTQAEESWWTHHIYIKNPDRTISIPYIRLYKVRVIK